MLKPLSRPAVASETAINISPLLPPLSPPESHASPSWTSEWSPFRPVPEGAIPVSVRQVLDRMVISVRHGDQRGEAVLRALREHFEYRGRVHAKGPVGCIDRFKLGRCRVNVVCWRAPYFFSVLVLRPSREVVHNLVDVLFSLSSGGGQKAWYLSQLEVALDVQPAEPTHLDLIKHHLTNGLVLPWARGTVHRAYHGTDYFASGGANVRKAPKGVRSYLKTEAGVDFVRLELQLNAEALTRLGLRHQLAIEPTQVNIFDHIRYHDVDWDRLVKGVTRRGAYSPSKLGYRMRLLSFAECANVAQSLAVFRRLTRMPRWKGMRKKVEKYFPPSHLAVLLPSDLGVGFVRRKD